MKIWMAVGAAALAANLALADDDQETERELKFYELQSVSEDPVTYRRALKQALEGHLAAYGLIITSRSSHQSHSTFHANAIDELGQQHMLLYPAGSETDSTRLEIWSQPEAFAEQLQKLADAASRVREMEADGNPQLRLNAVVRLGESCESCHQRFRIEAD